MRESTKEKKIDQKKLWLIAGIISLVLLIVYLGFSVFFRNHFFFGTTLNGMSISGYSVDKVKEKTEALISDYKLEITDKQGQTEEIDGKEIELQLQWDDSVKKLLEEQNTFFWPVKIWTKEELTNETVVSYNKEKLSEVLKQMPFMAKDKQIQPVNATVSVYSPEGYSVVPEQEGTAVNEAALLEAAERNIYALDSKLALVEEACYLEPAVKQDDGALLATVESLNNFLKAQITYQVGNATKVLDKETFHSWLSLGDNMEVVINEELVKDYVKTLEKEFNTCYSARDFQTSYGKTVTVGNSHYGWKIDREGEIAQIVADLKAGAPVTRDLVYAMTANSHEGNDYGNSYVEINLTSQHLFLYKNGQLILDTDIVSGNIETGHDTPPGVFGISYMDREAILTGGGSDAYVDFWMPFNGDIGLHDATWKSVFGAAYYKRDGSHGCINLPWGAAKTIFENVEANYPVIVYELPGSESAKGIAQLQAYEVIDVIDELGKKPAEVTLEQESLVVEARKQYDGLSDAAKSFVTNYKKLETAEKKITELKEAQAAAESQAQVAQP